MELDFFPPLKDESFIYGLADGDLQGLARLLAVPFSRNLLIYFLTQILE